MGIIRRKEVQIENSRLKRKIQETKTHKSKYLLDVIGLDTESIVKSHAPKTKRLNKSKKLEPI